MKKYLRKIPIIRNLYYSLTKPVKRSFSYFQFLHDYNSFKKLEANNSRFMFRRVDQWVCLDDKTSTTGFDRHYIYHTAWAARVLAETKPQLHIDISSSLYFCSIVSAFTPIKFLDYRPADLKLSNLASDRADILSLPFEDGSVDSLSCMHVVEHIGLGRYGDPIDYNSDLRAMSELNRVLAPGGNLLFVVPIGGKAKIQFNAHRIYTYDQIIDGFSDLKLKEFALIPEASNGYGLIRFANKQMAESEHYACGCFWFEK